MKILKEYIKESMLRHIAIELYNNDIIYEKYGLYEGCEDLIHYIENKISNIFSEDSEVVIEYKDVKNISNIVFDKMIIKFGQAKKFSASYIPYPEQELDYQSQRFKEVHMQFNWDFYLYNKIPPKSTKAIAHELTHLYNDYLITIVGPSKFVELFSTLEYQRSKRFLNNNYPSKIQELLRALYMLNGYERNGFVASIVSEIDEIKQNNKILDKPLTVNEIYRKVKDLEIYNNYQKIIEYIDWWKSGNLTNKEKNELEKWWFKEFDEEIDVNHIFKILSKKIDKLKRKLESIVPKKIAEKLDNMFDKIILD